MAGVLFAVLVIAGNALQGSTPALHGDAESAAEYFADGSTRLAIAMSLSLVSLFFLAWFLAALTRGLEVLDGGGSASRAATLAGGAVLALLAGGFALHAAGALRGQADVVGTESSAVFYDGSLALTGLAAPVAMAVLLAATASIAFRLPGLPRWFAYVSAAAAVLGVVTPLSFLLFLVFPFWVVAASVVLARAGTGQPVG